MPPIISGALCAGKIWIDDARGGAARCRRVALRQRRVAAFVIAGPPSPHMQANRISRIVGLGPSRHRRQNRRDRQNRQSRNAHQSPLRVMRGAARRSRSGPWPDFQVASRQVPLFPVKSRSRVWAAEWASSGSPLRPSADRLDHCLRRRRQEAAEERCGPGIGIGGKNFPWRGLLFDSCQATIEGCTCMRGGNTND
jgi:hypothetical protein